MSYVRGVHIKVPIAGQNAARSGVYPDDLALFIHIAFTSSEEYVRQMVDMCAWPVNLECAGCEAHTSPGTAGGAFAESLQGVCPFPRQEPRGADAVRRGSDGPHSGCCGWPDLNFKGRPSWLSAHVSTNNTDADSCVCASLFASHNPEDLRVPW